MSPLDALQMGWRARLPMVLQTEAAECGLACLAMIVGYHGSGVGLAELRRRFGMSQKGATLKDLVRAADALRLAARPLRLELHELPRLATPCVLHWDLNHFVVLRSVGRKSLVIHDPGEGVRHLSLSEASRHFTGVALELAPAGGFEREERAPSVRLRALVGHVIGLKRALGRLLLLALGIEVLAATSPLFMRWVVDDALVTADHHLLSTLALGFGLLLAIKVMLTTMRGWMLIALGASLKVQGRANLFSHLVHLPASFFEARHLGDVMSRFGSQETILQAITTDAVEVLLDGLLASVTLGLMFVFSPPLAAVVLAGAILYGALRWASYTRLRQASIEAIAWSARRDTHFLETLRGIKTIKLFNAQDDRRSHWLNLLVETVNRQLTTQKLQLLFRSSRAALVAGLSILVVFIGARHVLESGFSVGMLLAFIAYKDQFLDRVSSLINKALELKMLRLHGERLADIALTAPEPRDAAAELEAGERRPASVELRNVRFRYGESDPWLLDGVDLRIEAGESVAIVGPSGCGKTTLLKLLASLLRPSQGEILVDGQPLSHVGLERYRSMIGVVMQDDQLFAGSIADNICFFSDAPDQARIEACARMAAVHDDIMTMPMGYGTLIGDMGTVLSGGQKQRVLIARALYRQPGILLLDEATSHLDVARERAVNTAIGQCRPTRIIVAHRPETILAADRVVALEQGRVAGDRRSPAGSNRLEPPPAGPPGR